MYGIVIVPAPKQMMTSEKTEAFTLPGATQRATYLPGDVSIDPILDPFLFKGDLCQNPLSDLFGLLGSGV